MTFNKTTGCLISAILSYVFGLNFNEVSASFVAPDFAYPATVREEAQKVFSDAMADSDGLTALIAANELTVAARLVSPDSIRLCIERYRAIYQKIGTPFSELAQLLEARLLADLYNSSRYKFNQRELPEGELNPDPDLWSAGQIKAEISGLLKTAFESGSRTSDIPLTGISILLTSDNDRAVMKDLSIYDFIATQVLQIAESAGITKSSAIGRIPFGIVGREEEKSSENQTTILIPPLSVIDELIAKNLNKGDESVSLLYSRILRLRYLNSDFERYGYAEKLLDLYPEENAFRPEVVSIIYSVGALPMDSREERMAVYGLLKRTFETCRETWMKECLKGYMEDMTSPSINVECKQQWLSNSENKIIVNSANVQTFNLWLIPLTESQIRNNNLRNKDIIKGAKGIYIGHFSYKKEMPFESSDTISVKSLKRGSYAIVASPTPNCTAIFGTLKNLYPTIINVSDITTFNLSGKEISGGKSNTDLYVVNGVDCSPASGAKVEFINNWNSGKRRVMSTDKDGMVRCPYNSAKAYINYNGSRLKEYIYGYDESPVVEDRFYARILTELALYHPGDILKSVVVIGNRKDNTMRISDGENLTIKLFNPHNEEIEKIEGISSNFGRLTADFNLPEDGVNGKYYLRVFKDKSVIGSTSVEVADYKAPVFFVRLDKPELESKSSVDQQQEDNQQIKLQGTVMTYSGIPIEDSKVTVDITFNPFYRWSIRPVSASTFAADVYTDAKGRFELLLNSSGLLREGYGAGWFNVQASAVSPAGETARSASEHFSLSGGLSLQPNVSGKMKAEDENLEFEVKVVDAIGQPVKANVNYEIVENSSSERRGSSSVVLKGEFESPLLHLPSSSLPSGSYQIKFILPDAYIDYASGEKGVVKNDTVNCPVVIWRDNDAVPPMETPLWVPLTKIFSEPGQKSVAVRVGNSYKKGGIFYMVSGRKGIIEKKWIFPGGQNIDIQIPSPASGERVKVNFYSVHDLEQAGEEVVILPSSENKKLSFRTETFRDKLCPGTREEWRFRLTCDSLPVAGGVLAVMSNKALNAITPFKWDFGFSQFISNSTIGRLSYPGVGNLYFHCNPYINKSRGSGCTELNIPGWNFWGYDHTSMRIRGTRMMKLSAGTSSKAMVNAVMDLHEMDDSVASAKMESAYGIFTDEEAEETSQEEGSESTLSEELRDIECPLAFFLPDMKSDAEGNIDLDFNVPDFNTTWSFQLIGYDENIRHAYLNLEAIASKPIMVSGNIPGFLLTGDRCGISAMIMNNTDDEADVNVRIQIINPFTGEIISAEEKMIRSLPAGKSEIMSAEFNSPYDTSLLAVRIIAESNKGSDGEQTAIPVYPSSQPVMDSFTFYLSPDSNKVALKLPAMKASDSVSLNYCNDPGWYVITSLSRLLDPESESALQIADALFANQLTSEILKNHPKLKSGLRSMLSETMDNSLLSPLFQNESLKIAALSTTPWLNNAADESIRMATLGDYLEDEKVDRIQKKLTSRLIELQSAQGGWRWMKQMRESEYITLEVLGKLSLLQSEGYLMESAALKNSIISGVKYSDKVITQDFADWKRTSGKPFPLSRELDYFSLRNRLEGNSKRDRINLPSSPEINEIERDLLERLPKEWKQLWISGKISAAEYLDKKGDKKVAQDIMASVLQFASFKPDKGMWFENTSGLYSGKSSLQLTAKCVRVLLKIDSGNPAIDKMIRYIVSSRQTRNWSENLNVDEASSIAAAVYARFGNDEFASGKMPRILIGGEELNLSGNALNLPGNINIALDPRRVSGKTLTIENDPSIISWGGVAVQYVAPIESVKSQSVGELKITKSLLPISVEGSTKKAGRNRTEFKKGDLITISLVLENDRDMDYVIIQDYRGAFMQPVDQLAQYGVKDGIWMLTEPKKEFTNIYMESLPKGKHIISYMVTADRDGEYSTGIATVQSLYYPMMSAHTAGLKVIVK